MSNNTAFFGGSITIPTAGTYLITAQTGSVNGGGGTTTYANYYVNHSNQGTGAGNYGSTGTIMQVLYPYSVVGSSPNIANMSTIITITASTTFNLYAFATFSGNCQFNSGVSYLNYLRIA